MTLSRKIFNHIILLSSATCMSLGALSCSDSDDPVPETGRAILVYMVADNSLGSAGYDGRDIAEMTAAAANGDLGSNRLIVYHSSRGEAPQLKEITPEGAKALKTYGYSPSSVSMARMREVISDFDKVAPASSRGLVLWSHASAWIQNGITEPEASTYSWGDERGRYMNVTSLAEAVGDAGFDYIYFDCCYMANVESLYELRHATPRVVASTTELPADGMPYDLTLKYLAADTPDLRAAAETTFNHYNSLTGADCTCTISVIDMTALPRLAEATVNIYRNAHPRPGYVPQPFMTSGCYIYDMSDYLNAFDATTDQLRLWNEAFRATVIYSSATPMLWNRVKLDRANGLSTYIIDENHQASWQGYETLSWWHDVASAL